jgi:hypothetical protein
MSKPDMISSRPVPADGDCAELVREMAAIHRDAGMNGMRATIHGDHVWMEGWKVEPNPYPPFEPQYQVIKDH